MKLKLYRITYLLLAGVLAASAQSQSVGHLLVCSTGAVYRAPSADFESVYQSVKAKHDQAFNDNHVEMKEWMPFAVKTLRETDFSRFSSEQLLRLFNLNLFTDLPSPEDDEPLRKVVALVADRPVRDGYDALLKLSFSPQSASLAKESAGLYDKLVEDAVLQPLLQGQYADTVLAALAYYMPDATLKGRVENTRKLASKLPQRWPSDWSPLVEPLLLKVFTEAALGKEASESVRSSAIDAMERFLKDNPAGGSADHVRGSLSRLTGAAAKGTLIGNTPKTLEFLWSSDPKITKLSDLKGRVVVLDFWATWCGPCIASAPKLAELQKDFAKSPVTVLGITSLQGRVYGVEERDVDTKGNPEREYELTKKAADKHGMTWSTVFTKEPVFNGEFGIRGIPFTAILDPAGKVRYTNLHPGNDKEKIKAYVLELLKEFNLTPP